MKQLPSPPMPKIASLLLGSLLLTACSVDFPPVESCFVGNATPDGGIADKKEVSPAQLEALSTWFTRLGGEWKFHVTDHYPSGVVLVLKHRGGRTTRANLRGNHLWVGNRFRTLTTAERNALLAIVAEENLLPLFGRGEGTPRPIGS